jgi:hypothetical protein
MHMTLHPHLFLLFLTVFLLRVYILIRSGMTIPETDLDPQTFQNFAGTGPKKLGQ